MQHLPSKGYILEKGMACSRAHEQECSQHARNSPNLETTQILTNSNTGCLYALKYHTGRGIKQLQLINSMNESHYSVREARHKGMFIVRFLWYKVQQSKKAILFEDAYNGHKTIKKSKEMSITQVLTVGEARAEEGGFLSELGFTSLIQVTGARMVSSNQFVKCQFQGFFFVF